MTFGSDHFYIKIPGQLSSIFGRDVQINQAVIFRTDKKRRASTRFQKRDFKNVW